MEKKSGAGYMADWSKLDNDLLNLISQRFDNDLDLVRFQSVCSRWRGSSISNQHNLILPLKLPRFNSNPLSKHIILLIKSPPQQNLAPWLIRITQNSRGETQLFHPLLPTDSLSPYDFPYVLDINKFFDVVHLATHFVIERDKEPTTVLPPQLSEQLKLSISKLENEDPSIELTLQRSKRLRLLKDLEKHTMRKKGVRKNAKVAAVTCHIKNPIALGILNGKGPALFHCPQEHQRPIPCRSTYFDDICMFKERFYAVNKSGLTVAFGADHSVQLVAEYVDGGDMKFLVESEGELLLVDIYDSHRFGFPGEDGLRLDVLTLDENEKKWVKLTSLGDRVLFLGNGCSFSASALDLSVTKGNCVVFIDEAFNHFDNMQCGMCVFHLDDRRLSPLSDYPDYFNLFWPPPEWIVKMLQHS